MMNKRSWVSRALLLGLVLVIMAGCTAPLAAPVAPAADGAAATVDRSGDEYIYVSSMGNLEFFNAHKYGWEGRVSSWASRLPTSDLPSMT